MAITNHERIGKALEILNKGLLPFVEQELQAHFGDNWLEAVRESFRKDHVHVTKQGAVKWDTQAILGVMLNHWNTVFAKTLAHADRSLVFELKETRNKWAHQNGFSSDDTYRALDSMHRLLQSVAAPEAEELARQKQQLLRVSFEEQARGQTRKTIALEIEGVESVGLKPWRTTWSSREG